MRSGGRASVQRHVRDRPRILVLHPSDELYGADRVLLDVLDAIQGLVEPIVVLPSDSSPGPLSAVLRRRGIAVERLPFPVLRRRYLSPIGLLRLGVAAAIGIVSLSRAARRHRVHVIHANTSVVLFTPILAGLMRVPWVWHLHEIVERPRWLARTIGWLSRRRRARVIAVSRAVAGNLERCGGIAATVIHNPAPPRQSMSPIEGESRTVLMVGRVNGLKGHEEFTLAARRLHAAGVVAQFRMIGGAVPGREEPYERLAHEIRSLDPDGSWIAFAGHSADVAGEMLRATLVVIPSIVAEGFNITALEAMALGRPVVATAVGGLPEVVVNEETGLVVQPGDIDALARGIRRVVEDPSLARRLGEAGRQRAFAVFGRDAFQESWREVYRQLLVERLPSRERTPG